MKFFHVLRTLTLVAATTLVGIGSAAAGTQGDTIHATYIYPPIPTIIDLGDAVVTGAGASYDYYSYFTLLITDTQIVADFHITAQWIPGTFNGFVLKNLTKDFSNYSVNAFTNMSGFSSSNLSVSGDTLSVNWQNLYFTADTKVILDATGVQAPVPEPETYAMLLAGLGLVSFVARRRQKRA
jgi:hypothetical protein